MARILIVDDEDNIRTIMGQILSSKGHAPTLCRNTEEAMGVLAEGGVDLVVSDIRMEPTSGLVLLKQVRVLQPDTPVIMMTAYASVETALDALKMGAYDYLTKPFKIVEFIDVVERALASGGQQQRTVAESEVGKGEDRYCFGKAVGISAAMLDACKLLGLVAPTDATVLLHGERGTGRGLLALTIHEKSLRASGTCVRIDCDRWDGAGSAGDSVSAASGGLVEKLKEADGGTAILRNVELLPATGQAAILSLLHDKNLSGGDRKAAANVDVRVIATAGPELRQAVEQGRFDEDLYKRLGLLSVEIKPLCERREDVDPLFLHFLKELAGDRESLPSVSADVRGALHHYVWPGNVAELKQVTEYAFGHTVHGNITRQSLPASVLSTLAVGEYGGGVPDMDGNRAASLKAFLRRKGVELTDSMLRRNEGAVKGS